MHFSRKDAENAKRNDPQMTRMTQMREVHLSTESAETQKLWK